MRRKALSPWSPPPIGCLKLNFDGASKGNPKPAGFGYVLRNHSGKIVRVVFGPSGDCDSTHAKVMGLLIGLRELKNLQLSGVLVAGDSEVIVDWGLGRGLGSWRLLPLLYEIRELVVALSISLSHVDRCQNELANVLGVTSQSLVCENFIPEDY